MQDFRICQRRKGGSGALWSADEAYEATLSATRWTTNSSYTNSPSISFLPQVVSTHSVHSHTPFAAIRTMLINQPP